MVGIRTAKGDTTMTEPPENTKPVEEPEDDNAVFVVDTDTYRQNKQLKQIYKAKDEYAKLHRQPEGVNKAVYWNKLKALIMELEPLMKQMETNVDYMEEYHLTTVDVKRKDFEIHWSQHVPSLVDTKQEARRMAIEQGNIVPDFEVKGLNKILDGGYMGVDTDTKIAAKIQGEWKLISPLSRQQRQETATVHYLTGAKKKYEIKTFDTAYRACREFMSEAGLALQLEEDKGPVRLEP